MSLWYKKEEWDFHRKWQIEVGMISDDIIDEQTNNNSMFKAEIIADSINQFNNRLTTFVITFPRYILAEFNTHRMLSRNSASSRAIPFKKMMDSVLMNPFIPLKFPRKHSGMSATEYITPDGNPDEYKEAVRHWLQARSHQVERAQEMDNKGISKQITNRLLEPFMWHTVIVTASEWENFFALRASEFAEPSMQHLATLMLEVYNVSKPKLLEAGQWHIPFDIDFGVVMDDSPFQYWFRNEFIANENFANTVEFLNDAKVRISTARCARVSYTIVGETKQHSFQDDLDLHDKLSQVGHWSPFEHCARAMTSKELDKHLCGKANLEILDNGGHGDLTVNIDNYDQINGWSGNFRGFIQYRKMFDNENKSDSRVIKRTGSI